MESREDLWEVGQNLGLGYAVESLELSTGGNEKPLKEDGDDEDGDRRNHEERVEASIDEDAAHHEGQQEEEAVKMGIEDLNCMRWQCHKLQSMQILWEDTAV